MPKHATEDYVNGLAATVSLVTNEVPGGSVNGSNTAFTTASAFATNSLRVFRNGVRLKGGGVDYTATASGFTMVTAPATGDLLLVDYNVSSSGFSVGSNSIIAQETPTGSINSSNTTFTLARAYIAGSLVVYKNRTVLRGGGSDYTETTPGSGIFTMTTAPTTGDTLWASYQYNLNPSSNADTVDGIHADSNITAGQLVPLDSSKRQKANGIASESSEHISLAAGTNKLVKTTVLRQDNTTNTYQVGNTVILTGWGIMPVGAAFNKSEAVTFGVTFTQRPIVFVTFGGDDTAGGTNLGDGNSEDKADMVMSAHSVTTTGFTARGYVSSAVAFAAGTTVFYHWMAIGEIA